MRTIPDARTQLLARYCRAAAPLPTEAPWQGFMAWLERQVRESPVVRRLHFRALEESRRDWHRDYCSLLQPRADGTLELLWIPRRRPEGEEG
jgi:hypothetical protein